MTSANQNQDTATGVLSDAASAPEVASASAAIRGLRAAIARLPGADALCEAALRKEAVAAATAVTSVRLGDLLLFEAASPTHPAHEMCRKVEAELAACRRYLGALSHGYRCVSGAPGLTARALLDILAHLADVPCSEQRETIAATATETDDWLGSGASHLPAVAQAALVQDRLARLATTVSECAMLGRIAALIILRNDMPSPLPMVIPRHVVSPCPEASSDARIITHFADGVVASAAQALAVIDRVSTLTANDEARIATLGKAAHSAHRVQHAMRRAPVIALPRLVGDTGLHVQAVTSALHRLRALGIVREITGRYQHRVYSYDAYIAALEDANTGR